jgi:hypothetical protein
MSAETAIDNLLDTLQALSTSYRGTAAALVKQADDALTDQTAPDVGDIEFDVVRPQPTYTRVPLPPTLEGLANLTLPILADLQAISPVEDEFAGTAPALVIPEFDATPPDAPPTFTESAPELGYKTITPTLPTITATEPPPLTRPTAVSVDPVSGTAPTIPLPVFNAFTGDFHDEYLTGIGLIGGDIADWQTWLSDLGTTWMQPLLSLLTARLRAIMVGDETAVPEDWETQSYDQAQQPINAERWAAQRQLDEQPAGHTELPTGQRVWARLDLELKTAQATMLAASKLSQERQTLEVKHLQWAMALAAKLIGAAMELRAQEAGWRMKGLLLAIEGATGVLDLALKLLALKERELAILMRYNDLQVRRTEDHLKIELTKLESLRVTLESNRQIATYNEQNVQVYTLAEGWVETRVRLFQQQIDYLKVDIAWRKLALQAAESNVSAYSATVKAKNAEYAATQAQIKGDLALVKAEMAKVTLYEAQAAAFSAKVRQLSATVQAQAAENDSRLQGYLAEVSAKIDYLKQVEQYARVALSAMAKGFAAETSEQELVLSSQQLEDQQALHDALMDMQIEQTDLMNELKAYQLRLAQAEATGRIMDQGAVTLGGIASTAYAGLNSVGTKTITEFA